jgi:aminomethyltransferase
MTAELRRTPLWSRHQAEGARTAPFAGWEMPIQYPDGPLSEHRTVRSAAGVFDICHMGRFEISGTPGSGPAEALDRLVSSDVLSLTPGGSTYGLLCREDGGILDDLFVYRLDEARYLVVVNAANREKDYAWILSRIGGVTVEDVSEKTGMLAVQGPEAIPVLERLADPPLAQIPRFASAEREIAGVRCLVGRTGYTGEDGVELFCPAGDTGRVWDAVRGAGITPIGLAARDSLRFEPGFSLYGHELSEDITPVEARLTWACCFDRPFIGSEAIQQRKLDGPERKLVTFRLTGKGVPREGCEIFDRGRDRKIGQVVSGMFAPTVELYAGNAYVETGYTSVGTEFEVRIRDKDRSAVVVKRPLYPPRY